MSITLNPNSITGMFSTTGRACNEIYPILQFDILGDTKIKKSSKIEIYK